jgi:hypothetical protein
MGTVDFIKEVSVIDKNKERRGMIFFLVWGCLENNISADIFGNGFKKNNGG